MENVNSLSSRVQLSLSCKGLPKLDLLSKSDPFVVVYIKEKDGNWTERQRTSTIWNDSNPQWSDHVVVEYFFEAVQDMRLDVYDRDSKSDVLSKHDFIGSFETTMSKLMGSRGCTVSGFLVNTRGRGRVKKPGKFGKIIIHGEEVKESKNILKLRLKGTKLDRKNYFGFGKSDPFYVISRVRDDGGYSPVFTSEVKKVTLNPIWDKQSIQLQRINNGDNDRAIKIEIFDWESNGRHQFIGQVQTTIEEMKTKKQFNLTNEKSKKKKGDKHPSTGILEVMHFEIEKRHSFLEYIRGGCELNLVVGIDFTASNGHPMDTSSLHYMPPQFHFTGSTNNVNQLNEYQKAILSVGQILQDYDSDKLFPTYGFGGERNGKTSHCFPLTFDESNPEVHRVEGLLQAYQGAMKRVNLSGPTYFSELISTAIMHAEPTSSDPTDLKYTVLLILTDGIINDMNETIEAIVQGSSRPFSIIVVGVGNADFSNMEVLDADDIPLVGRQGKKAKRDIVQFVPFTKFASRSFTALAEEVLKEIPEQLTGYFSQRDIKPNPPRPASERHFEAVPIHVADDKVIDSSVPVATMLDEEDMTSGVSTMKTDAKIL